MTREILAVIFRIVDSRWSGTYKHLVSFFNHEIQDVYLYLDDIAKQETY